MIGKMVDRLNTWSDHIDVRNTIDGLGIRESGMTYSDAVRKLFGDFLDAETERGIINHKYQEILSQLPPAPDTLAGPPDHPDPLVSVRERAGAPDRESAPQFQLRYACRFCKGSYGEHSLTGSGGLVCHYRHKH